MAKYIITVADKDDREMEYLMHTLNTVFIKVWGEEATVVDYIEPYE